MQHQAISGIAQNPWRAITVAILATDRMTAAAINLRIKSCRRQRRFACPAIPIETAETSATITQSDSSAKKWLVQSTPVVSSQGLAPKI